MKAKELQEKTSIELEKMLGEKRSELVQLRFDVRAGQQKNFKQMELVKKDIARIRTQSNKKKEGISNQKETKPNNNQDDDQRG